MKTGPLDGHDWTFSAEYHLTGFQGRDDSEPTVHRVYVSYDEPGCPGADEDHLHELLMAKHVTYRPDPADYMPEFPEGTATGGHVPDHQARAPRSPR